MTDVTAESVEPEKPRSRVLLMAIVVALLLGGAAFGALYFGVVFSDAGSDNHGEQASPGTQNLNDTSFDVVPIDQLVVSLGAGSQAKHLVLTIQLEVPYEHVDEVSFLRPRIVDVVNSYLMALQPSDIEERAALIRLRGQLLRRVQVITGDGKIRDLLITEFVLN